MHMVAWLCERVEYNGHRILSSHFQLLSTAIKEFSSPTGIKTKVVDVTQKDQVEALAKEHEHVDVLFNVAGYFSLYCILGLYSISFCHCQDIS